MILYIIIFFVAIIISFGMLSYRAWEIKTARAPGLQPGARNEIRVPFRKIEKTALYLAKHLIQSVLVILAKYWFILSIKIKKKYEKIWPKIHDYLLRKKITSREKNLFIKRAVFESKVKIRRIREKIRKENHLN